MRFKEILVLLLEVGNFKVKEYKVVNDGDTNYILFYIDNKEYAVVVQTPDLSEYKLKEQGLGRFNNAGLLVISFGDVLKDRTINFKHIKVEQRIGIKVISAIKNLISDCVKTNNPEVIIFSARKNDGAFEARTSLYSRLTVDTAKLLGYSFKKMNDSEGSHYILIRDDLEITSSEYDAWRRFTSGRNSFTQKAKLLIGK